MKHLKVYEEFEENKDLDLINSIREYLIVEYPESWWNDEFSNRVYDYCEEEEWVGEDGDPDDESTWEYAGPEEAYQNFCNGGAIEYDLIGEIHRDICEKFHLTNDEYFAKGIGDVVENHMCNMIDWYDPTIFGEKKVDGFGFSKSRYNDLSKEWDTSDLPKLDEPKSFQSKLDDLEKSKDEEGYITLKDGRKIKI